jgi:GT2 family glycosyltransferase
LDSDDLWRQDKLAATLAAFERYPDTDLVCHNERVILDGRVVRVTRRRASPGRVHETLLFEGNLLSPSAVIVRREAALDAGGFDERPEYLTVEDYDFWLRFSRAGCIRFLDEVLGDFVLRENSASRRIVFHHEALETMLRAHLDAYLAEHPGLLTRLRARRRLARVYRSAARQLIAHREDAHGQHAFVARMLRTYPFEVRNVAVACLWVTGMLRRPVQVTPR